MAFISKTTIQEVKDRLDAIAVIGEYVRLEKKSGRWWGRCPFHAGGQEKTPSFKVDPDLKLYHCFGCGAKGNVIGFVMEMEKTPYPETIKTLAQKMGIEIIYEDGGTAETKIDNSRKDELFELYRRTTVTFSHFLCEKQEGQKALDYIINRGISKEMIELFRLGYAPSDRRFLFNFLTQKGYSEEFLEKSGLFSSNYKNMPMFSNRLMFPICDRQNRVIAFGGRAMPGSIQNDGKEPPKYINSPETEIYKKGQTLYALNLALPEIRKTKTVCLAEGNVDVIALHQAGIINAVAPLGTAFTDEQAKLLRRWAEKIILILDTDEAGEKAAYKSILICRKNGLYCDVAQIQQAIMAQTGAKDIEIKDPAEILQKFGAQILKKIVNYTINDMEYLISRTKSRGNASGGGRNRAADFLFPYLEALDSEIEREECITVIADNFGVDRSAVQKDYNKRNKGGYSRQNAFDKPQEVLANQPLRMNNELFLLTVVSVNMNLYPEFRSNLEIREIDDPFAKELFIAMEECYIHDERDTDSLLARITNEPLKDFIASRGVSEEFRGGPGREPGRLMEDGINEIKKKRIRIKLADINAKIRMSERTAGEEENINELLAEKKYLDSQMRKLEGR
ncbi:MAG: DNA primase [Treponema sp.]|jgi:DNA primase|nr:DNA primase [Treponema sp.]